MILLLSRKPEEPHVSAIPGPIIVGLFGTDAQDRRCRRLALMTSTLS
jgi:hypothetical protein